MESCHKRFAALVAFPGGFEIESDEFFQLLSWVESVYGIIISISRDNGCVADGSGRRRAGDYFDDFIGPTGYVAF
jgi:hypothetical protein